MRQISSATFTFREKVSWSLDGEFGGSSESAKIRVFQKAVQIRTGKGPVKPRLPRIVR